MEGFALTILKAVAIGIIISAPMGPVGILCIQRTLNKGRAAGFFTGVGAAISDLIYCMLTVFGLSFIEGFLDSHQTIIRLIGSIVLIAFGLVLLRKNPSKSLRTPSSVKTSWQKEIITGFLFTFSNPLIIFLIIGLFAQFNYLSAEMMLFHHITGFLFILAGALLWWYIVTFTVNKIRAHFNLRSMWLVNRITGSIVLTFAAYSLYTCIKALCA